MLRMLTRYATRLTALLLSLLTTTLALAQAPSVSDAIRWRQSVEKVSDTEVDIVFTATISPSFHLYATDIDPKVGPTPTHLQIDKLSGGELIGGLTPSKEAVRKFDPNFEATLGFHEGEVSFKQRVRVQDVSAFALDGALRFMVCNDQMCMPPTNEEFAYTAPKLGITQGAVGEASILGVDSTTSSPNALNTDRADLWASVQDELKGMGDETLRQVDASLWMIFVYGFLGGLVALITPCVWPMIPMTVSFFLKRTKDRRKSIIDALTYGVSIILIYLALGLLVTGIFGAGALNALATEWYFNLAFFILLIVFAVSFFGAFEITLPASWTNKMDQKADSTTGFVSILFMAFTLALVSFSCTGPIVGTLLVQAATMGTAVGPMMGMLGFSLALALPFVLFALFPSWLQAMPSSGGWLGRVKVVLGFLELALALKFLSVADLAYGWRILDREVFLVLWIVIFALLGVYLLGGIRFAHDSDERHTSISGLFMGMISLAFALYMLPGLWGAPLKAISAFAPPSTTQDFDLYDGSVHAQFDDYELGMEYARKQGKPVLIDFSGFGCVNCRKMEASVWTNPEVKRLLEQDYVLITLMVDDKTPLPSIIEVEEQGKTTKLRTIGDKWSYLQRVKFGAVSQPYYIALDPDGRPLTTSRAYNEDVIAYIQWLRSGLATFDSRSKK